MSPAAAEAFDALLARVRPEVDRRLERVWAAELRRARRHDRGVVPMVRAARDLTLRGGKRFRAAMVVAAYAGARPRAPLEPALQAGVAVELLQSYLLIQDDWMDGDDTRRGGPSVHAALERTLGRRAVRARKGGRRLADPAHVGAACAVLASDMTWGLAVETLASIDAPASRVLAAIRALCRMHDDVVIGQQMDVLGHAGDIETMHALKTGSYTVRGPLLLGATIAGSSQRVLAALARYATPLGVAFQLRDDLLGAFGSTAQTGKPEGGDLREAKRTAVLVEAERRLDARGRRVLGRVLGRDDAEPAALAAAREVLEACGARGAVEARLSTLCGRAERLATRLPLSRGARAELAGAAAALRPRRGRAERGNPRQGAR